MSLAKNVLLWASGNRWMKDHLPRLRFVRRAVTRFMPGETIESALTAARLLHKEGFLTVLTSLGENITTFEEALAVRDHYVAVLNTMRHERLPTELSVKLTQLGLDLDPHRTRQLMEEILRDAEQDKTFVWIDIESSSYVDRTVELYSTLRKNFSNVGVCLQSYLYRTSADLDTLLPFSPSIRLVKGAYREPASIAFPKKSDVDRNYLSLAERLMKELPPVGSRVGIATHDRSIIDTLKMVAERHKVGKDRFEFQMLYGIGRETQRALQREGYRVRVLISYGSAWYPWYMRRLAERPANLWFVLKNIAAR